MWNKLLFGGLLLVCSFLKLSASEPIDVVIPVAKKDAKTVTYCIEGIKKNCVGVRDIYIISAEPYTEEEWIDEQAFPFSKQEIANILERLAAGSQKRAGWYYQQLLKLYAFSVIPEISSNLLVVDADTIFLKPVTFIDRTGKALYNVGVEQHLPYLIHCKKLLPNFQKAFSQYSGICHHMLFQKRYLEELFSLVEEQAQMEFWRAFCLAIDPEQASFSGASEYELYFNFVFSMRKPVSLRPLKWANKPAIRSEKMAQQLFQQTTQEGLDYVSCHTYEK